MLLIEYLTSYTSKRALSLAPRTIEAEERYIRLYIAPICGTVALDQVSSDTILAILRPVYAAGHTRTAQCVYTYLLTAAKGCSALSAAMIGLPKPKHQRKEISITTAEALSRLISEAPSIKWRTVWLLAGVYALRRAEIIGLRWRDIDLDANTLHICNQRQYINGVLTDVVPKSRSSRRVLPIDSTLSDCLAALYPDRKSDYVIDLSPYTIYHALRDQCAALHIPPISVHGLRHTAASIAAQSNCNLKLLQQLLGHSSESVTANIYCHIPNNQLLTPLQIVLQHLTLNQGVQGSSP